MTAALAAAAAAIAAPRRALASSPPPPPSEGDCADCVGVVDGLLNSCPGETEACVSSQERRRGRTSSAPWAYPGDRVAAIATARGRRRGRRAARAARGERPREASKPRATTTTAAGGPLTPAGEFTLNAPPPPRAEIGRGRSNARSAALASRVLAAGSFASAGEERRREERERRAAAAGDDGGWRRTTKPRATSGLVVVDGERSSESVGAVGAVGCRGCRRLRRRVSVPGGRRGVRRARGGEGRAQRGARGRCRTWTA